MPYTVWQVKTFIKCRYILSKHCWCWCRLSVRLWRVRGIHGIRIWHNRLQGILHEVSETLETSNIRRNLFRLAESLYLIYLICVVHSTCQLRLVLIQDVNFYRSYILWLLRNPLVDDGDDDDYLLKWDMLLHLVHVFYLISPTYHLYAFRQTFDVETTTD